MLKLISLALLSILLASCGGGDSSSTTSSTTKTTPSAQLEATIKNRCKTNCDNTVPADNPSSRLEATIKKLNPNANTTVPADNPSVRLAKVVSDINFGNLCKSGQLPVNGCPTRPLCLAGGNVVEGSVQDYGTPPNTMWQCQCPNGTIVNTNSILTNNNQIPCP